VSRPDPNCEICRGAGQYRPRAEDCDEWRGDCLPPMQDCCCEAPDSDYELQEARGEL
jgi:hypothetical protein